MQAYLTIVMYAAYGQTSHAAIGARGARLGVPDRRAVVAGHTAVEGAQGKGFVQGDIEGVVGSFADLALVLVFRIQVQPCHRSLKTTRSASQTSAYDNSTVQYMERGRHHTSMLPNGHLQAEDKAHSFSLWDCLEILRQYQTALPRGHRKSVFAHSILCQK